MSKVFFFTFFSSLNQASIREREDTIRMLREQEHLEMCSQQEAEEKRNQQVAQSSTAKALERQLAEAEREKEERKAADRRYREQVI